MAGDVEGDVQAERRLSHGGAGGDDDQIGRVKAAQHVVQIGQAGGQARQSAVPVEGLGGHADGAGQGLVEGHEAGGGRTGFRQGVELLFGLLDLFPRRKVRISGGGDGGDVSADPDQVPAQGQVIDHPGIVRGVGGGGSAVDQVGEVADAAELLERRIPAELFGDQDRFRQLAATHGGLDGLEQAAVERLVEMLTRQAVEDPLIGGVVIEEHAQKGLFGLNIGRRLGRFHLTQVGAQIEGGNEGHALWILQPSRVSIGRSAVATEISGDGLWTVLRDRRGRRPEPDRTCRP